MSKSKVLFLCTGNSCRSQMAEGLAINYLSKRWKAYSAGTKPKSSVHPMAIKAMSEVGIDISRKKAKRVDKYKKKKFDLVITVCDQADEECPVWLGSGKVVHISFPDPAKAGGTEEEQMAAFRAVRDDISRRVLYYLTNGRVLIPGANRYSPINEPAA